MDLRGRYVVALRRMNSGEILDLSPSQLAAAASEVVGARAGGLVMAQEQVPLPVGASSPEAEVAEQLQASLADGPCRLALQTAAAQVAGEADLAARWPLYQRGLHERTPFRSVISFPLVRAGEPAFAALTLYFTDPAPHLADTPETVQLAIGDLVGMLLLRLPSDDTELPAGSDAVQVERRHQVWIAVGRLVQAGGLSSLDALAVLRAHAFRMDLLIDDLAARLVSGRTTTTDVLGPDA